MFASRLPLPARFASALVLTAAFPLVPIHAEAQTWRGEKITGSGVASTETRSAASFRGVVLGTDTINVTIGGSGRLTAAGRADALAVVVAGSGELSAGKLESRRAMIALQGSAQADLWAKETLDATIAGSGEITYRGRPQVNRTVIRSGTVRQAGGAS